MDNPDINQPESKNVFSEELVFWLSESSTLLPGWPGYRTQPKRSGYDPVDIYAEYGHMQGVLIRKLIKLRLQPTNFLSKILLACASIIYLTPLIFIFGEFYHNIYLLSFYILIFSPNLALGILLLINLLISFRGKQEFTTNND